MLLEIGMLCVHCAFCILRCAYSTSNQSAESAVDVGGEEKSEVAVVKDGERR